MTDEELKRQIVSACEIIANYNAGTLPDVFCSGALMYMRRPEGGYDVGPIPDPDTE